MKDQTYHESAIQYNDALAVVAEDQADKVEDPEVKKWCRSVGKQHRFHAKRHRSALAKLQRTHHEELEQRAEADAATVTLKSAEMPLHSHDPLKDGMINDEEEGN